MPNYQWELINNDENTENHTTKCTYLSPKFQSQE